MNEFMRKGVSDWPDELGGDDVHVLLHQSALHPCVMCRVPPHHSSHALFGGHGEGVHEEGDQAD